MNAAVRGWAEIAVRYRWFVGFGLAWFAIVTTVSPVTSVVDRVGAGARSPVRGTLGAVSSPTNSAAAAIPTAQGFDATVLSSLDSPVGPVFDEAPSFEGFDAGNSAPAEEPATEEPPTGGAPATECTTDSSLPAPVVTTVVGAIAGAQQQAVDATGQNLPADPAGAVGAAAGCSDGSTNPGGEAAPTPDPSAGLGRFTIQGLLRSLLW